MKTKDDKLRFVMEAADEEWHEISTKTIPHPNGEAMYSVCSCGWEGRLGETCLSNPSPDDIGKLMDLADKLGYGSTIQFEECNGKYDVLICPPIQGFGDQQGVSYRAYTATTRAEALLNALFVAKGGKE